jgi:hypothetical protein
MTASVRETDITPARAVSLFSASLMSLMADDWTSAKADNSSEFELRPACTQDQTFNV